jgi:hypothetical protein
MPFCVNGAVCTCEHGRKPACLKNYNFNVKLYYSLDIILYLEVVIQTQL